MANDFFLEIGCEEIPARMIRPTLTDLKSRFEELFEQEKISHGEVQVLGSARRLVVRATELADNQEATSELKIGPPVAIAFDDDRPSKALKGFAKKSGISVKELEKVNTDRGEYMAYTAVLKGRATSEILSSKIANIVEHLSFPKTMYWTKDRNEFARPVRWVLALFNGTTIPLELFGIKAGGTSDGHRVLGNTEISVKSFSDYIAKLEKNFVIVSMETRKKKIETELTEVSNQLNGKLVTDDSLLEEVTFINEYPTVISGEFEERYLELPREVLIMVMKEHQKYFALEKSNGSLMAKFLAVINTDSDRKGLIRLGHERVLGARLSDALFFWEVDGKRTLDERADGLNSILFQKELGTYAEKIERMRKLGPQVQLSIGSSISSDLIDKALKWSKSDLTTDLVGEFPGLQGVIGGLYARREGAEEEVWQAIYDQYRPQSIEDRSPTTLAGSIVSLTDSLDSLIGCFSVGLIPTGSADPLGLRRHTQGIIKILIDHNLPFSLKGVLAADSRLQGDGVEPFLNFWKDRLHSILTRRGFSHDEISAALSTSADNPSNVLLRLEALHKVRQSPDLEAIAAAFKRIKNILKQASNGDKPASVNQEPTKTDIEPPESALTFALSELDPQIDLWVEEGNYHRVLEEMIKLRPLIDTFFDELLVMHEDMSIRTRRLLLLERLLQTFLRVGDISEMVVPN